MKMSPSRPHRHNITHEFRSRIDWYLMMASCVVIALLCASGDAQPLSVTPAQLTAEITTQLVRYRDPATPPDQRAQALDTAISDYQRIIDAQPNDPDRLRWQTDLAELLLHEKLPVIGRQAAMFMALGVPRSDQIEMIQAAAPTALQTLTDAQRAIIQHSLDQRPTNDAGVNLRQLDYLLAEAAYLTALLPDESPWYAAIEEGRAMPHQAATIADERQRLLEQIALPGLRKLDAAAFDDAVEPPVRAGDAFTARIRLLIAQVYLATDQPVEALRIVEGVSGGAKRAALDPSLDFMAQLIRVRALSDAGEHVAAIRLAESMTQHPRVMEASPASVLDRLLVTDAHHLALLRAVTPDDGSDLNRPWRPYVELLEDPAVAAQADAVRQYVYERMAERVSADADMRTQPAIVVLAAATIAREQAQVLMTDSFTRTPRAGQADRSRQRARAGLDRARGWLTILADRADWAGQPEILRVEAMFNSAYVAYLLGRLGDPNDETVRAIRSWADLAATAPHRRLAERGMGLALAAFHEADRSQSASIPAEALLDAYEYAAAILWNHFPATDLADAERSRYAQRVFLPRGKYDEALALVEQVPRTSIHYEAALAMILRCNEALIELRPSDEGLHTRAEQLVRTVLDRAADATPSQAGAYLLSAQLLLAGRQYDQALAQLDRIDPRLIQQPEIQRRSLEKRLVILQRAERWDDLIKVATEALRDHPGLALGSVHSALLTIEDRLIAITRQTLLDPAKSLVLNDAQPLAQAAWSLASLLHERATVLGLDAVDMRPHELALARALRWRGEFVQAEANLQSLIERYPRDAQVLFEAAETHLMRGLATNDLERLRAQAAPLYDQLITGLAPDAAGRRPEMWWHAWTRRLFIMHQTGDYADQISSRVRGLRLTVDPMLGGDPYRTALETLEKQYTPAP